MDWKITLHPVRGYRRWADGRARGSGDPPEQAGPEPAADEMERPGASSGGAAGFDAKRVIAERRQAERAEMLETGCPGHETDGRRRTRSVAARVDGPGLAVGVSPVVLGSTPPRSRLLDDPRANRVAIRTVPSFRMGGAQRRAHRIAESSRASGPLPRRRVPEPLPVRSPPTRRRRVRLLPRMGAAGRRGHRRAHSERPEVAAGA